MATSVKTVQYICDQAGLRQRLTYRKMFGEFALYLDEKTVAFVCDDQLFLKPTPEGRACLREVTEAPPYPGAKHYFLISSELDDPERLSELLQVTAKALPLPKPKPKPTLKPHRKKARSRRDG